MSTWNDLWNMTLAELRKYARDHGIILHHTLKKDIIREIYYTMQRRASE